MVELVEAGSPDSGYRSNSPRCAAAEGLVENTEEWPNNFSVNNDEFTLAKDLKISTQYKSKDRTHLVDQNLTCDDGSQSTCLGVKQRNGANLPRVDEDKPVTSGKNFAKKRRYANRQLEDENSSPVLGIKILPAGEIASPHENFKSGNVTKTQTLNHKVEEVTETSKEGSEHFMCRLCAKIHSNALELAQHRCPRIVNVRYECSECGKNFGCPANLASHKRWHKPKASCSDTMANPEGKRRKLSVSPVPAFNDIPHAVPARENLQAANRPSPLAIVSQEERSIPSPSVRLKAIFPCPGCKRRFRRESNRRKHALVKHDIVIPYEPTTKQEKKLASPIPKEVVSSLEREQTMPAPPMRCNLTTLALAAEAINGASLTRPHGPTTPKSGGTQPLDLTNKSTTPLSHGVDQILNLSKTKSFVPSQFPAVNNVVSAHLKHRLLQGNIGFIQGATGRGEQQLQTNHFQQWPHYHAQHLFTDYRYLAAIAADRMLACQYRM